MIILLVFELLWSFFIIFFVNETGERASLAFNEIDEMVNLFDSYCFPSDVQKMLPIFMVMVQKPFRLVVFGSVTCGRDSFKEVSLFIKFTLSIYCCSTSIIFDIYSGGQ